LELHATNYIRFFKSNNDMFIRKLARLRIKHLKTGLLMLADTILFILLLPFYLLFIPLLWVHGMTVKKRKTVIFAGLEHVINKTVIRSEFFENKGFRVKYYSFEKTGNRSQRVNKEQIIKAARLVSLDILQFFGVLIGNKPIYLELYFEGLGLNQLFYSLFCSVNKTFVASVHRGIGKLYHSQKPLRNHIRQRAYNLSSIILYRDPTMKNHIFGKSSNPSSYLYDFNKAKIFNEPVYFRKNKSILFLNGIQGFRRIHLLIEAMSIVIKKEPKTALTIVGCRNEKEFDYVKNLAIKYNIRESVAVNNWTESPFLYYEKASVFVLPADVIFCNFSLIECMERGVPAIVADVEDADKIVKHGVNGFLAKQTAEDIAKYILILIGNEDLRIQMGKEARKTIVKDFNDKDRMKPIYSLLTKQYPDIAT
jgi:glycosyltransferase involved in cell wall biosynthesis